MSPLSFHNNDQKYEEELPLLETGDWPSNPIKANLVGEKILVFNLILGSFSFLFPSSPGMAFVAPLYFYIPLLPQILPQSHLFKPYT